jgi:tetratricopeptide (TPR) repeat protein
MRNRTGALALSLSLLGAFALSACAHAPHARHDSADADARLAAALKEWDQAHASGMNNGAVYDNEEVVVDSGAAKLHVEQVALEFPRHVPTLVMCAQLTFQAGETEKAAAYADRALALQADNNFAGIIRAQAALSDGNVPKAREVIKRQLSLTPDSCYLHEVMAGIEYYAADVDACQREVGLAERYGSDPWRIAYHRGLIAEKRGNTAEAKQQFEKSAQLCPTADFAKSRLNGIVPPALPAAPEPPK